jgi:hypothetical protein
MYNYMPTLFDELSLPDGYNKETFINSLLLEHGEKCVMYSNPDFMRDAIGVWGKKWDLELTKIYEALTAKYDPIYNYDRFEEITDSKNKDYTSSNSGTHSAIDTPDFNVNEHHNDNLYRSVTGNDTRNRSTNASDSHTESDNTSTTDTKSDTIERTVSADNSSNYQAESKDMMINNDKSVQQGNMYYTESHNSSENEGANSKNEENTSTNGDVSTATKGKTQNLTETSGNNTDGTENEQVKHTAHLYGNIGVTTSASMVTEILEQRFKYNLYGTAAKLFANELLIGVY